MLVNIACWCLLIVACWCLLFCVFALFLLFDDMMLTKKQQQELHKAIIQYLEPLGNNINDNDNQESLEWKLVMTKLADVLDVDTSKIGEVIPNYLEKKWSTVIRLQKRIMELETETKNLRDIMNSQPATSSGMVNGSDKINWVPSIASLVFKTQANQHVTTVVLHPFLPIVVCGCDDGSIIIWNLAVDGTVPEKIIRAHTRAINKICWSRAPVDISGPGTGAGTTEYVFASCGSDLAVKVWNGSSYKLIRNFMGHEHTVSSVAFSGSDPKLLYSVSRDKTIKVWDLVSSNCIKSYIGHSDWVRDLDVIHLSNLSEVSPFGDFVLTCSNDQSIRLSHAESGTGLSLLIGHGHVVEAVKFLPLYSNRYIDGFVEKNSTRFPSMPSTLFNEPVYTTTLGFKYCISCGRDNSIRLWLLPPPVIKPHRPPLPSVHNNSQGWLIDNLIGHASWVKSIAVHPNGRFIFSASDDKTIKIWDLETLATDGKVQCIKTLTGHEGFVSAIDFASFEVDDMPDEDKLMSYIESRMRCIFISGGVDSTVRLWK